jgi:hypothetical protein
VENETPSTGEKNWVISCHIDTGTPGSNNLAIPYTSIASILLALQPVILVSERFLRSDILPVVLAKPGSMKRRGNVLIGKEWW